MSKQIQNDVTLEWVKAVSPYVEYGSQDTAMEFEDAEADAIAADLSTGESLIEREHPVPPQPHSTHGVPNRFIVAL